MERRVKIEIGSGTVSLGTSLAVVLSYLKWKSVGWAILHGVLSWAYVLYFVVKYGG